MDALRLVEHRGGHMTATVMPGRNRQARAISAPGFILWAIVWVEIGQSLIMRGLWAFWRKGGIRTAGTTPVTTKSNVVAQKRLAFVLDWSGTAFTPVPEALGPAPQRMWLRGALRQCGGWRRTNLKEDPNAQAQIGTHKNIALAQEQDCSPQIRDAVESLVIDHGRPRGKQTSPAYYNAAGVVGCDGCRDDGGHGM